MRATAVLREYGGPGGVAAFGLWLVWLGGLLLVPLGLAALALGVGLAVTQWRRARFARAGGAPGVVEVTEGEVRYFGPDAGGAVALPDLVEIRLIVLGGRRCWRLRTQDGQALLIPLGALGAERLFDSFAALPGMRTGALVAALDEAGGAAAQPGGTLAHARVVWRHPGRAALT